MRPHLVYGDNSYGQSYSSSFHERLEMFRHNTGLDITVAACGTSK